MATLTPPSLSSVLASNTSMPIVSQVNTSSIPTTNFTPWSLPYYRSQGASLQEAQRLANIARSGWLLANDMNAAWNLAESMWVNLADSNQNTWPWSTYAQFQSTGISLPGRLPAGNMGKSIPSVWMTTISPSTDTINWVKKTYVPRINTQSFTDTIGKSRTRAEYNTGINYDALDEQSKKIADRYYTTAEKSGKLLPPKDMYQTRQDAITAEKMKEDAYYDVDKARQIEAAQKERDISIAEIDPIISQYESERDAFISGQEKLAKDTESNRLNHVRGNIMQVLAQRGVDISKLSPEQIVALSGEQGAKAFMDIIDVRERTNGNIKQARDNALARLNDLHQRKAISSSAYERNVANINSQADAAKLNADKNAGSQTFALTQTKTEQGRTDATQRVNAVTNMASMLGLSGTQIGPLLKLIETKWSGTEQVEAIARMMADPNSQISKSLAANMSAAKQDVLFKRQVQLQELTIKNKAASRPSGHGWLTLDQLKNIEANDRAGAPA